MHTNGYMCYLVVDLILTFFICDLTWSCIPQGHLLQTFSFVITMITKCG